MRQPCGRRSLSVGTTLLLALTLAACGAPTGAPNMVPSVPTASTPPVNAAATHSSAAVSVTAPRSPIRQTATRTFPNTMLPLAIAPSSGPAGTTFEVIGAGLPPNATLHAVARGPNMLVVMSRPVTVGPDGTFTLRYDSLGEAPGTYTVALAPDLVAAMVGDGLAGGIFTLVAGGPIPTLTLEPNHGPCTTPEPVILARGRDFPPGKLISLYVLPVANRAAFVGVDGAVAADGTFALPVRLNSDQVRQVLSSDAGCGPATPDGASFRVNAVRRGGNVDPHNALASATFTADTSAPPLPVLPTQSVDRR